MKVVHLNTWDIKGGAARGTYWLHHALQQAGVDSNLLVAQKDSDDFTVIGPSDGLPKLASKARHFLDNLPVRLRYPHRSYTFSPAWLPNTIARQVQTLHPDIVHLHWICAGFLTPKMLTRFQRPIVWTLRDMWAFTGGCHYTLGCEKYAVSCGACPYLNSSNKHDLSRHVWQRKATAWKELDFTIVAISHWLAECAQKSSLFQNKRIEVIHNALDASVFKPIPKGMARQILNLPQDQKIILFGAINAISAPIKGFDSLKLALKQLRTEISTHDVMLAIFGSSQPQTAPDLGFKAVYLGRLYDNATLALVYSAADVTVVPSIQEAFGKTAMESLACGTPVVSFDSTGLKDIVEHQQNGYRATCFDSQSLAKGIAWVLEDDDRWQKLSCRAREKVEQEFTLDRQAQTYLKLYRELYEEFR